MPYDPTKIEPKWQRYWDEHATFKVEMVPGKPKLYVLDMFPYPSGAGLHVGHPEGYTATDIVCRFKRMQGFNVLHPMGWDAFGLPAERYAIRTGVHPAITTAENIATFRGQIKRLGFSYDWSRELSTTDPEYVRWTQWIFLQLYDRGLAYQAEIPVNWCPAQGTVLANEEYPVQINGKLRAKVMAAPQLCKDDLLAAVKADPAVQRLLAAGTVKKEIVVPGKLVNFVVAG